MKAIKIFLLVSFSIVALTAFVDTKIREGETPEKEIIINWDEIDPGDIFEMPDGRKAVLTKRAIELGLVDGDFWCAGCNQTQSPIVHCEDLSHCSECYVCAFVQGRHAMQSTYECVLGCMVDPGCQN